LVNFDQYELSGAGLAPKEGASELLQLQIHQKKSLLMVIVGYFFSFVT
jgi:hypothetical protein